MIKLYFFCYQACHLFPDIDNTIFIGLKYKRLIYIYDILFLSLIHHFFFYSQNCFYFL